METNGPLLFWALLPACLVLVNSFNLVLENAQVHQSPRRNTWFGYDVGLFSQGSNKKILVGAPKGTQQVMRGGEEAVNEGGVVVACTTELERSTRCNEVPFDISGQPMGLHGNDGLQPRFLYQGNKTGQLFGATITVSKSGGSVLACAPRYRHIYTTRERDQTYQEPVGRCILATNNLNTMNILKPHEKRIRQVIQRENKPPSVQYLLHSGYHRMGSAMLGFSAALPQDNELAFMGGPGAWYFHGTVVAQNLQNPDDLKRTWEGEKLLDDQYTGYSMAAGDFNNAGLEGVAVGIPRGHNLTGQVALYNRDLHPIKNISGEQIGSYFGGSIAASDLNGDGMDDLIVGAPHYSKGIPHLNGEPDLPYIFECGKVYIFYQNIQQSYEESSQLMGKREYSRFGRSVAAAGDLDQDGFNDIVVGAPYDGEDRRGAIYVFHGSAEGIITDPVQIIMASDLRMRPSGSRLQTFGFSLDGGTDIDDNQYPDLAVGAYASDQALLIRTRPVVRLKGGLEETDLLPDQESGIINLQNKRCSRDIRFSNGSSIQTDVTCRKIQLCLEYDGKGVARSLQVSIELELDAMKDESKRRAFFTENDSSKLSKRMSLRKNDPQNCEVYNFYLSPTLTDKLRPIKITANASLSSTRDVMSPMLDQSKNALKSFEFDIKKDCGSDKKCIPDLRLFAKPRKSFLVYGTDRLIILEMEVLNGGENAYEADLILEMPKGVEYRSVINANNGNVDVTCGEGTGNRSIVCKLGNPLKAAKGKKFDIELELLNLDPAQTTVDLKMKVNSTNPEENSTLSDNEKMISLEVKIEMDININGKSDPERVLFDRNEEKINKTFTSQGGRKVTHIYEVANQGSSKFGPVTVDIFWPSFTQEGKKDLLYLVANPDLSSNVHDVSCVFKQEENVNRYSLINDIKSAVNTPNTSSPTATTTLKAFLSRMKRQSEIRSPQTAPVIVRFRDLVKRIRNVGDSEEGKRLAGQLGQLKADCSNMACTQIVCTIPEMPKNSRVLIKIPSVLWVDTMIEEAWFDATISSIAVARVEKAPYERPNLELPTTSVVVSTIVNPKDPRTVKRSVPFWLILLAALAGITFLILLILLLWKLGFFKRTRPPRGQATMGKAPESEFYGYTDYNTQYAPASMYNEQKHGQRL